MFSTGVLCNDPGALGFFFKRKRIRSKLIELLSSIRIERQQLEMGVTLTKFLIRIYKVRKQTTSEFLMENEYKKPTIQ